jgi:hypothetical protein
MVIISTEIPPAGYQSNATPSDVLKTSMIETEVPDGPPPALHPHLVRNLILGIGVAATGWAVGITQLSQHGSAPAPARPTCQINPQTGKCG